MRVISVPVRLTVGLTVAALFAGCASDGSPPSFSNISCNPGIAAAAGGTLGAIVTGGNRLLGAAVGAGIAALVCVAVDYEAKQLKTPKQAQTDYEKDHHGHLPRQAEVVKYTTAFASASIPAGSKATLRSYIEVVNGTQDASQPTIEEEATIYKPDGSVAKSVRKPVTQTASAGAFSSSFTIPMPQGVPQGAYPVKSTLYLNGVAVEKRQATLQVVASNGSGATYAMMTPSLSR